MAAAKSNTNWFVVGVSAAVVVVLIALGALVVFLNNQATDAGPTPGGAAINQETGAISVGDGETEIDTYIDFMCPVCGQFEETYGEQLQTAALNGDITLNVHPVAILDFRSTTDFSSRAAAAMYCVAESEPDAAIDFMNILFQNQPTEGGEGLTDEQLTAFASEVGADSASSCIADGTYLKFPKAQTNQHEITGTPTVEIDGERIDNAEIGSRFASILG